MKSLPGRIMGYAEAKPETTPVQAKDLLHLGDRAAVSRALSGLAPLGAAPADLSWRLHASD